jgi:hypothetical protein
MAEALEQTQIPYILVGSYSSNIYAVPRSTKDADFVLEFSSERLQRLRECLGPDFSIDFQSRFETVTGTFKNVVQVAGSEFEIELFRLSNDPHDQSRFRRRVRNDTLGFPVWIPTAEDVIITKLRWAVGAGRGKDRDDIQVVIGVQRGRFDWDYIHHWTAEHGTRQCLDDILNLIPSDLLATDNTTPPTT